jgi:hypothetical protein
MRYICFAVDAQQNPKNIYIPNLTISFHILLFYCLWFIMLAARGSVVG